MTLGIGCGRVGLRAYKVQRVKLRKVRVWGLYRVYKRLKVGFLFRASLLVELHQAQTP